MLSNLRKRAREDDPEQGNARTKLVNGDPGRKYCFVFRDKDDVVIQKTPPAKKEGFTGVAEELGLLETKDLDRALILGEDPKDKGVLMCEFERLEAAPAAQDGPGLTEAERAARQAERAARQEEHELDRIATFLAIQTLVKKKAVRKIIDGLMVHKQIFLTGDPGCGKTFFALSLASLLTSSEPAAFDGSGRRSLLLSMTPDTSYTSVMQGFVPVEDGDSGGRYRRVPGQLKGFVDYWKDRPNSTGRLAVVIDEANRCNLNTALGEAMTALDPRGKTIPLSRSGTICMPENLFIIGTLNPHDTSVSRVDDALLDRFLSYEFPPKEEGVTEMMSKCLERYLRCYNGAAPGGTEVTVLEKVNLLLKTSKVKYTVGHARFLSCARPLARFPDNFERRWTQTVVPILERKIETALIAVTLKDELKVQVTFETARRN